MPTATHNPASAQRKFTDLAGSAENQGDLKSIVLHKLTLSAQKSSFPTALGLRVTGVDDSTFSCTGDSYSAIAMPSADTHVSRVLQEDDTSLGAPLRLQPRHRHSVSPSSPVRAQPTSS